MAFFNRPRDSALMDLSIIIVNWNSAEYLRKCLISLYKNVKQLKFEIIVVDNASYDGCEELIRKNFPDVLFIQSSHNLGFAKANNIGFKNCSGRNALFLNPDTEVVGPAINKMHLHLLSIPDSGALGCKLINTDLSIQTSCIKAFPTILNQALDIDYFKKVFPNMRIWGMKPLFNECLYPQEVDVVSGACIMVKRNAFEEVGMFSQDYFMYSEDVDLCYKIRGKGYRIHYLGDAQIIHHGGVSTKELTGICKAAVQKIESRYIFFEKHRGKRYAKLFRSVILLFSAFRLGIILGVLLFNTILAKKSSLNYACNKWTAILKWSSGLASGYRLH